MTELIESHVKGIDKAVADLRVLQDALVAILNDSALRQSRGEDVCYCDVVLAAAESSPGTATAPAERT